MQITPASIVVYGPQGCGKTRNAQRLKKALGLSTVVDDWKYGFTRGWPRKGALLLFIEPPPEHFTLPAMTFAEAMRKVAA